MNKGLFVNVFILLLCIMLVDAFIFTGLWNVHLQLTDLARERAHFPNTEKSFDFWVLVNPIGIFFASVLYLGVKMMFCYYPLILAYMYVFRMAPKNYSLLKLYPGVIAIFFLSASTFLTYTSHGPKGSWPSAVAYEAPFGNAMYIALFASLAAPFIVKVILTWLGRRKKESSGSNS